MAENKKGFVLYASYQSLIDKLPDELAGRLFKLIMAYVNDENPQTNDLLLDIAFEPIKLQLKRDLQKYEQTKVRRSEAGQKSAEVKKQNSTKSTNVESVEQTATKSTVKDNVKDTVTVKEEVKVIVSTDVDVLPAFDNSKNLEFAEILKNSPEWITTTASQKNISPAEFPKKLDEFVKHLATDFKIHPNKSEFAKHFKNWIPINQKKNGTQKPTNRNR